MFGKAKVAMMMGEFLGVAVITSVILAVSKSGVGFSVFMASAVGLAVVALTLAVGSLTGGHFNPAVTIGLWTTRKVSTLNAAVFLAAQFLGGLAAWQLYEYVTNQPLNSIAGKSFDWRVLVVEGVGAMALGFIVAAAIYKGYTGFQYAAALGGAFMVGMLVASMASNGLANPAVAVGVRSWSRAYAIGPLLGGVVGVNLYALLFTSPEQATARVVGSPNSVTRTVDAKSTAKRVIRKK